MDKQKKKAPKIKSLRLTANALQNIDEITDYIAFVNHQPLNAIKVGDAIFKTLDRIKANPFAFGNVTNFQLKQKFIAERSVYPGKSYIK